MVANAVDNGGPDALDEKLLENPIEKLKKALSSKPFFQQYYLVKYSSTFCVNFLAKQFGLLFG